MRFLHLSILFLAGMSCGGRSDKKSELDFKAEMKKPLFEISSLQADGNDLWAITDKPRAVAYKIDKTGKVLQEVTVSGVQAIDVEAVTSDKDFIYIGDVGDNDGDRGDRQIIKFRKTDVTPGRDLEVKGEVITFRFSDEQMVDKKKKNNYDCESLMAFGDSLYLFTKRREDHQSELFSIPKTAGNFVARSIGLFDTKGLVTDAAVNPAGNEVALCGYNKGHKYPFILLFKNFKGDNFFTGQTERIELADKDWDWQIESITYTNNNEVLFACEQTQEVKATLYGINRNKLQKLNKKGKK